MHACMHGPLAHADAVPPPMQLDVTFPYMPCEWMSLDTMDVSGDLHLDVVGAGGTGLEAAVRVASNARESH